MPPRYDVSHSVVRGFCLFVLAGLVLLYSSSGSAQVSPGPLSRAHSSLEGTTNCTQCHKPGSSKTFKCLDCHTEINARLAANRGFHATAVQKEAGSQTCGTCHSEHNGADFGLVRWIPSQQQFDHAKTGWNLDGKHIGLTCAKCHNASHVSAVEKTTIRIKDLNRTFLGLSPACNSCHTDEHKGQLGTKCQDCHNTSDWKKVERFDHSRTKFALTGGHVRVECAKCHVAAGPEQKPKWSGLDFASCTSCHRDPHKGSFNATCQSCHSTQSWKSVSREVLSTRFDHSKTKFALLGKHASVQCAKCHSNGDFKRPIAFEQCSSCHRPDPHSGQFAKRADKGECSSCHTVDGWKPVKFAVAEHAMTAYPLEGRHVSVACAKCHIPAGRATVYKIKFAQCTDCHRDTHAGQFKASPWLNRCESCHSVKAFRPSSFALSAHKNTRFPLEGAHLAVACGECHAKGRNPKLQDVAAYRFERLRCTSCHQDPHKGQFAERMTKTGADRQPLGCLACHSVSSWKDLTKFDHASTRFELLGSHRAVACSGCHKPPSLEVTLLHVDFRSASRECEGCHADPHAAQFVENGKPIRCSSCHNTNKWKPSLFDHDRRTTFKLEGVHANIRCARCHSSMKTVADKEVLFYKPTPKECVACHGADVLNKANQKQ